MRGIQLTHRESIDRVSRRRVLLPKPYFLLDNGRLVLHGTPVPKERPEAGSVDAEASARTGYPEKSDASAVAETSGTRGFEPPSRGRGRLVRSYRGTSAPSRRPGPAP